MVSVTITQLWEVAWNQPQTVNKWAWLHANETWFVEAGRGLDVACMPQSADPCSKGLACEWQTRLTLKMRGSAMTYQPSVRSSHSKGSRRQWGVSPLRLHSKHLLVPSHSPSPWSEPFSYPDMQGSFQTSGDSPSCTPTCPTQFLVGSRPVERPWQVKGPTVMHPFFSYSNQWWPSFVPNPQS